MIDMSFKKLQVWQKGISLVKDIYTLTRSFPKEELYGIVSQMRRSAISIPSNITEGSQRTSDKDFRNFLLIAKGSLAELHTHIIIAEQLAYIPTNDTAEIITKIEEVDRMLRAFCLKLTA